MAYKLTLQHEEGDVAKWAANGERSIIIRNRDEYEKYILNSGILFDGFIHLEYLIDNQNEDYAFAPSYPMSFCSSDAYASKFGIDFDMTNTAFTLNNLPIKSTVKRYFWFEITYDKQEEATSSGDLFDPMNKLRKYGLRLHPKEATLRYNMDENVTDDGTPSYNELRSLVGDSFYFMPEQTREFPYFDVERDGIRAEVVEVENFDKDVDTAIKAYRSAAEDLLEFYANIQKPLTRLESITSIKEFEITDVEMKNMKTEYNDSYFDDPIEIELKVRKNLGDGAIVTGAFYVELDLRDSDLINDRIQAELNRTLQTDSVGLRNQIRPNRQQSTQHEPQTEADKKKQQLQQYLIKQFKEVSGGLLPQGLDITFKLSNVCFRDDEQLSRIIKETKAAVQTVEEDIKGFVDKAIGDTVLDWLFTFNAGDDGWEDGVYYFETKVLVEEVED